MRETEIKILDIDRKEVESRLLFYGARKIFEGAVHALYLDTPDRRIRGAGGMLRLRREGQKAVLTYKGYIENREAKVREEQEVEVSDFETARIIFDSSGFIVWLEMIKDRTTFECEGLHFEIDKYHGEYEFIPEFLEIEGPDITGIHKYVDMLASDVRTAGPWDALEVAAYYSGSR